MISNRKHTEVKIDFSLNLRFTISSITEGLEKSNY